MAGTLYQMTYAIKGALDASFSSSFKQAQQVIEDANKSLNKFKTNMSQYNARIAAHQAEQRQLNAAIAQTKQAFSEGTITQQKYIAQMEQLKANLTKVTAAERDLRAQQKALNEQQRAAKIASYNELGDKKTRYAGDAIQYGMQAIALAQPIRDAMKFESVMADVRKVVDFDTPDGFQQMSRDVLELSKRLPMTSAEIAKIIAAAGQSGIASNELMGFAESAVKMGVAFDLSADQAGQMMSQWRIAFGMSQDQVNTLADKINYLGNTSGASAANISAIVTRIGPLGAIGGVASGEIAALGASMNGVGVPAEIAATGIKNLVLGLSAGAGATKSQAAAFSALGLDAEQMAQRMQVDAKGAILDVMKALQNIDASQRSAILTDLFGKESVGAIAPLLSNLDNLEKNFNRVSDAQQFAGSTQQEYAARAATTENQMILFKNAMEAVSITAGSALLPAMNGLLKAAMPVLNWVSKMASEYPTLTAGILGTTVGFFGLAAAFSAGMWVFTSIRQGIVGLQLAYTVLKGTQLGQIIMTYGATAAQWALNAAIAVGSAPVWLLIGAVMALIGIGYLLISNWDTVKQWFILLWNDPQKALDEFVTGVQNKFGELIDWIGDKWNWIKSLFSTPIEANVKGNATANGQTQNIQTNARGGIYNKGAFLTWFAEDSREAAIPLDGSARAIALWQAAGQELGQFNTGNAPGVRLSSGGDMPRLAIDDVQPIDSAGAITRLATGTGGTNVNNKQDMPIQIDNSVHIVVQGDNDRGVINQIKEAVSEQKRKLKEELEELQRDKRRVEFA